LQNESKYPRNKVMALRDALRGGPETTKRFIAARLLEAQLPQIPSCTTDNGWIGGHCAYFDAIEAMEFFIPL
jgi:hypothetical protein